MEERDHCKIAPAFCPGKAGQNGSYEFWFGISEYTLPPLNMVGKLELFTQTRDFDEAGKDYIVCVEFPAKFIEY